MNFPAVCYRHAVHHSVEEIEVFGTRIVFFVIDSVFYCHAKATILQKK